MKIFFATPSYKGLNYIPFCDSLEATVKKCSELGYETEFSMITGCCYVQSARNELVYKFMQSNSDVLFFLDDDISWHADKAIELIQMKDDVVAGIYPMKSPKEQYPVVIYTDASGYPVVRQDGCIAAKNVPTGFLKINRSVIEKLEFAYPSKRYVEIQDGEEKYHCYDLFPQGVYNGRWVGEDYAFCNLWCDISGQIWVVPNIDFCHAEFNGNYHEFLKKQPRA